MSPKREAQLPMGACRKVVEAAVVRTPALDKTFCGVVRTKETGEVFVWVLRLSVSPRAPARYDHSTFK